MTRTHRGPRGEAFAKFNPAILVWFPLFAAIVISLGFADRLPETVTLHWDIPWRPDSEERRMILLALFPALQLIHLLSGSTAHSHARSDASRIRARLLVGIILLAVQVLWLRAQAGVPVTEAFLITAFIGALLTLGGFFMSTSKQNALFGVRTAWTLSDARVWEETHRIAGPLTMATGGLCFVFGILLPPATALGAALVITLASAGLQIFYSHVVAKGW